MKKVLVTGANGFLGSLLVKKLIENGVEVIAADMSGCNGNIPDGVRFVDFDMRDFPALKSKVSDTDIDAMYHMAWIGSSGPARADYALQLENAKCTCDAVKTASEMGIKRFVGAGTLAQMDCSAYIGKNGSTPNGVSCYGTAKIAAQYMSKAQANSCGIEHIWCVISNTYGIGNTTMNFVNFASKKMLAGERASFTAAEQNYDFVYITDTINGLYLCGKSGKPNCSYYIGSGKARKLKEYITTIRDAINPEIPLYLGEVPFNGVSLPLEAYSCDDISADTGYCAQVDFEDGIVRTIEWLKEQNK
ncbi:MAG: NAD-dependent epimerase/dehydratase family protein [Oscillospiraceae bacterium]